MAELNTAREGEYETCLQEFLEFEQEYDVSSIEVAGIPIWERIRISCFKHIVKRYNLFNRPHTKVDKNNPLNYIRGGYKLAKSMMIKNPFFASESDFFFIGSPRRKPHHDGFQWDLYCDPILENLDLDYIYTEPPYRFSHRTPAKTKNIKYLDPITYLSVLQQELGLAKCELTEEEKRTLIELEEGISERFGVSVDLYGIVREKLRERKSKKWLYERLLSKINPKITVVVAARFKKTFIEVCKEKGIPVVELQHGTGHHNDPEYSYSENMTGEYFPDYIFVFGEFWKNTVDYPIPQENIYPVGYPYLENKKKKHSDSEKKKQVIFTSQWTIGEELSNFAADLSKRDSNYNFVYKLHPKEYHDWKKNYPWLIDAPINVISDDTIPLYKLLSQSEIHVSVYSTVVYEGLAFGLDTYLLDAPGVAKMKYLIENETVSLVSSVDEFDDLISNRDTNSEFDIRYFFGGNPINKISEAFDEILKKEY